MMRAQFDYYSNASRAAQVIERLASHEPALLAANGAAFRGNGAAALHDLATALRR
jgi:hypothetical protein